LENIKSWSQEESLSGKEGILSPTGYREVREWLAKNRNLMVNCPNQPGKLLISKNACSKKHKAGLNPDLQQAVLGYQTACRIFVQVHFCLHRPILSSPAQAGQVSPRSRKKSTGKKQAPRPKSRFFKTSIPGSI